MLRDRNRTLLQNYRRIGLMSKLNGATGGVEKSRKSKIKNELGPTNAIASNSIGENYSTDMNMGEDHTIGGAFSIPGRGGKRERTSKNTLAPSEARVERDPETGRILRLISASDDEDEDGGGSNSHWKNLTLDDPLNNQPDSDLEIDVTTGPHPNLGLKNATHITTGKQPRHSSSNVVAQLEARAAIERATITEHRRKRPRHQSQQEIEWIERLVQKHGKVRQEDADRGQQGGIKEAESGGKSVIDLDFAAMARDARLNPMQQTEADIRRRVEKWKRWQQRQQQQENAEPG